MKTNALTKYNYQADWLIVTGATNNLGGDATIRTYAPNGVVRFAGGEDLGSGRLLIASPTLLKVFERLVNIRGLDGKQILPSVEHIEGGTMEVRNVAPLLNTFGYQEGYRYTLVRVS